ncbi:MAG TPA: ATP-binding cassette domain-containing protein [Jatrophihabitantaceae bacterium]|nr:ATP-binding cassette domain-containing protein [Jatrophihabitantaceae bacterium]
MAALRGLSLSVPAGERLVVHGPNGSGKTTLLRVLAGEVAPSAGTVSVAGVDLAGADEATRSRLRLTRLGIVDQHSARALRPELDVTDNVSLQLRLAGVRRAEARRRAAEALDRLDLGHLAQRRPATLSGGEAQRVAVCAALAHEPTVVLADEPTGELDLVSADAVYELLASAVAAIGATLLLVTHDQRAAGIADRVVRIRDGRLSEQWVPHAPNDELLVVDDRGWVRLPESMRRDAGAQRAVRAIATDGHIVLDGADEMRVAAPRPTPTPTPTPRASVEGTVAELRDVRVAYGDRVVLNDLDLDVCAGALTLIRGRSGSGKSTVLRVLTGLADPDAGRAGLAGVELGPLGRAARADLRREHVAVAGQGGALAEPLDVIENLALARVARGLAPDPDLIDKIVESLGLTALRARAVRLLSGGERQRVAVARSLVVERPLVVLDEPTSSQDEAHAEIVARVLAEAAASGRAVVCATHDPVLAVVADTARTLD